MHIFNYTQTKVSYWLIPLDVAGRVNGPNNEHNILLQDMKIIVQQYEVYSKSPVSNFDNNIIRHVYTQMENYVVMEYSTMKINTEIKWKKKLQGRSTHYKYYCFPVNRSLHLQLSIIIIVLHVNSNEKYIIIIA